MPLTSTARRAVLAIGTLVVLAIGIGLRHKSSERTAPQQAVTPANPGSQMNPYGQGGLSGQMPMGMPDMAREALAQVALVKLMTRTGLDQQGADYFRQVQTEVVSQSETSIHYVQTFPESAKADTTVTFTPGQQYTPTSAEMERAARAGAQVYNLKLTTEPQGPKKVRIYLQYFVPYSAIPAPLQEQLHLQSAMDVDLIPAAWAQESGGGKGVAIASDTSMETFKEISKQIIEKMGEGTKLAEYGPTFTYGLLYGLSGIQKYIEHEEWMNQLDEMEACAKENPLSNKALQTRDDPTDESLYDARTEIEQVSAVRGLNVATSFAAMFVPGIFGTVMTPVATWNDESLKELGEQNMTDARKAVPTCKEQPSRSVNFEYS